MSSRETAWRVLGAEFAATTVAEKGEGERGASHLLSPLGAWMNRVLVVGTLEVPQAAGRDPTQPFLRSRLTDPTGSVPVTAGSFQPRAVRGLTPIQGPTTALVVGKAHLYTGRDQRSYPSVRAESIRAISEAEYRLQLVESTRHTLDRIELAERLRSGPESAPPEGTWPKSWVAHAREAIQRYPAVDPRAFRAGVVVALDYMEAPPDLPRRDANADPSVPARVTYTPARPAGSPPSPPSAAEGRFLEIVDELGDLSIDGYADLKEVYRRLAQQGVDEGHAEEMLNRLEESGVLEEPIVGKLRRA